MGLKSSERAGCHNCYYWSGHSSFDNGDELIGDCQRFPPRKLSAETDPEFPATLGNVVCGEFVDKAEFVDLLSRNVLPPRSAK